MTLSSEVRKWLMNKFENCNRNRTQCQSKADVISVDMMQWCNCRSYDNTPTWKDLGQSFLREINTYLKSYPNAQTFYFIFDYCGKNDAKLITSQERKKKVFNYPDIEYLATEEELQSPGFDSKFSKRLYRDDKKQWRCPVFYQFLAYYFYNYFQNELTDKKAGQKIVISGLCVHHDLSNIDGLSILDKKLDFNTINYKTTQLNNITFTYEVTNENDDIVENKIKILIRKRVCERYPEGDLRQLFYLLRHEEKVCMVCNVDGDLFSAILLYIALHQHRLKQNIVWVFDGNNNSIFEDKRIFLDMIQVYKELREEFKQKSPWCKISRVQFVFILLTAIYLRGNDFVHKSLNMTNVASCFQAALRYGKRFEAAFPYVRDGTGHATDLTMDFIDFDAFAAYCYLEGTNKTILRPDEWTGDGDDDKKRYDYMQLFNLPFPLKKTQVLEESDSWKSYLQKNPEIDLLNGKTSNAFKTYNQKKENENSAMLKPYYLPILFKQILFCFQYSLVYEPLNEKFDKILDPFEVDPIDGKSIWGMSRNSDGIAINAESVHGDDKKQQNLIDAYMTTTPP